MKIGRLVKKTVKNSDICHAVIVSTLIGMMPHPAMAVGPQCVNLFRGESHSAADIRNMKEVDMKALSQALKNVDDQSLLKVFQDLNQKYQTSDRPKFVKDSLATLTKELEKLKNSVDDGKARGLTLSADHLALKTGKVIMNEIFRFHNSGMKSSMNKQERQAVQEHFDKLQRLADEAMIYGHLHRPGPQFFEMSDKGSLTDAELASAGKIGKLSVVPGDMTIQASKFMSSTYILDSQDIPGLGSHNALITDIKDGKVIVTEALIEDGVNQRVADIDTVQRYYVLSLRNPEQRKNVADAIRQYDKDNNIPFDAGDGSAKPVSPVAYDASMSWEAADKGIGVSCATLVGKIFEKAGFTDGRGNPFSRSNGSYITGVFAKLYDLLSVSGNKNARGDRSVPSPTDPMLASNMELRGFRANYESLIVGRQMRVAMDAFMNLLETDPRIKAQFFAGLEKISNTPVDKAQVLAKIRQLESSIDTAKDPVTGRNLEPSLAAKLRTQVSGLHSQIEKSLPEKANLRQIALFASMNGILQPLVINKLGAFEKAQGGYVSQPELAAQAQGLVKQALQVTSAVLNELPADGQ